MWSPEKKKALLPVWENMMKDFLKIACFNPNGLIWQQKEVDCRNQHENEAQVSPHTRHHQHEDSNGGGSDEQGKWRDVLNLDFGPLTVFTIVSWPTKAFIWDGSVHAGALIKAGAPYALIDVLTPVVCWLPSWATAGQGRPVFFYYLHKKVGWNHLKKDFINGMMMHKSTWIKYVKRNGRTARGEDHGHKADTTFS